jgi:hypothetical protein
MTEDPESNSPESNNPDSNNPESNNPCRNNPGSNKPESNNPESNNYCSDPDSIFANIDDMQVREALTEHIISQIQFHYRMNDPAGEAIFIHNLTKELPRLFDHKICDVDTIIAYVQFRGPTNIGRAKSFTKYIEAFKVQYRK